MARPKEQRLAELERKLAKTRAEIEAPNARRERREQFKADAEFGRMIREMCDGMSNATARNYVIWGLFDDGMERPDSQVTNSQDAAAHLIYQIYLWRAVTASGARPHIRNPEFIDHKSVLAALILQTEGKALQMVKSLEGLTTKELLEIALEIN